MQPATWLRELRGRRAGSVVLVSALLGTLFVASVGAGYTASRPLNETGGAVLAKGKTVAYVNGESRRVEAEARALASGRNALETVTLRDGRVAVVENQTGQVWIIDTALLTPQGAPIIRGTAQDGAGGKGPGGDLTVVAGPRHSYLVDTAAGTVEEIDPAGVPRTPVQVPGGTTSTAVPDRVDGVWVLTRDRTVVYVRDGQAAPVDSRARIAHLTLADGRPIALAESGELLDMSADPARRVSGHRVPHGPDVVVGSPKGAGRWILVVDGRVGELTAVDPQTGERRVIPGLPARSGSKLGSPVMVGDTAYVPDHDQHLLHVRNVVTGEAGADIRVPGRSGAFSLEVHGEKVWANDQFDRAAVVIGPNGDPRTVDKGTGEGLTNTTALQDQDHTEDAVPNPAPVSGPVPGPATAAPLPAPAGPAGPPGPVARGTPGTPEPGAPPAPEQVRVPDVRAGTDKDDACRLIEEAGLLCATVAGGDDGQANEVIDTVPPGGSMVPPGYRVTVRHYGPRSVPRVIGRFTSDACRQIKAAGLRCVAEATPTVATPPAELDVISEQDPAGGAEVSAGAVVTVRYANRAKLGNYLSRPGAQACADIEATYREVTCTVTEGQTEQQTGQPARNAYAQSPAPGAVITMGQSVTITVVKGSPRVPDVRNMSRDEACQTLRSAGYGCDARPDQLARHAVVTTQDTAPGTPMDGGTVVIHYAPHEPVPLRLYESNTGEPVYILRRDGAPDERYTQPHGGILGYGYDQPSANTWPVWGHFCTRDTKTCLGWTTNHYQSRNNQPAHPGWTAQEQGIQFIRPVGNQQCASGQVAIYRFADFRKSHREHDYITGSSAPESRYTEYSEFSAVSGPRESADIRP